MPNGGSDCCGTCWFNGKNQGEAGYAHSDEPGPDVCEIRGLAIENAFWTYCANHPHHTGRRVQVPVGPVYVTDSFPYRRRIWVPSPDSEEVRANLLGLLAAVPESPPPDYPAGASLDEAVIRQLGEFRDPRALRGLERVRLFDPASAGAGQTTRNQQRTIALAEQALAQILPAEAVDRSWLDQNGGTVRKLAQAIAGEGRFADLPVLADALEDAGCRSGVILAHCRERGEHPARCWVLDLLLGTT
jgi:hypothetical protein